ncbi:MAG: hypothetical protein HFH80_07670 [Lachnospiraceae bacterium]|nr:hypothetical protein [Lachnospiraceae bacterium]
MGRPGGGAAAEAGQEAVGRPGGGAAAEAGQEAVGRPGGGAATAGRPGSGGQVRKPGRAAGGMNRGTHRWEQEA